MMMSEQIPVEVVYADATEQQLIQLEVTVGCTAMQAVELSGLVSRFNLLPEALKLGIFGKAAKPDAVLRAYDRVEIYRPLIADPKEVRRRRAKSAKSE